MIFDHHKLGIIILLLVLAVGITAFSLYPFVAPRQVSHPVGGIQLSSSAFSNGSRIPLQYTCDGGDVSPPLSWSSPPTSSKALALVMEDPDVPVRIFTHWVLFNIPSNVTTLRENIPKLGLIAGLGFQGTNDFDTIGYRGPCPPAGILHHYRITLYALDTTINLSPGSSKEVLSAEMEGHILATGELVGTYER